HGTGRRAPAPAVQRAAAPRAARQAVADKQPRIATLEPTGPAVPGHAQGFRGPGRAGDAGQGGTRPQGRGGRT
ncbi:MAG: hypothetical protein ACK55Z_11525, partial [bacterium]